MKRVLVVSDFHCGHEVGLTPPAWNTESETDHSGKYRGYIWKAYEEAVRALHPIDLVVANGDLIDGRGERSGSLELITVDRRIQAKMAAECIKVAGAPRAILTRGTDYHVGKEESWEDTVADFVRADGAQVEIGDIRNVTVNGLSFNFRHHIGGSQTPVGRATPLAREAAWNALWHARQGFGLSDVIVRSHVHYHTFAGGPGWLAMTTPGLQGYGTRYGERRMSGIIDLGFVYFDVEGREEYSWKSVTFPFPLPQPSVV
jgi:hypothetical protein